MLNLKKWQSLKPWLKGGIIGGVIYLLLALLVFIIFRGDSGLGPIYGWILLFGSFPTLKLLLFFFEESQLNLGFFGIIIISFVQYFFLGAFIGAIAGAIKKIVRRRP